MFGSLASGRAYVDTIHQTVASLDGSALIDALERLDHAYDEFPELALDRPRHAVLTALQSTAEDLPDRVAIPLLMYCAAVGPPGSPALASLVEKIIKSDFHPLLSVVLHSVCHRREFSSRAIEPLVKALRQQGQAATVLQLISEMLGCIKFSEEENASEFGDVLKGLLNDQQALGIDGALLARAAASARHRLNLGRSRPGSREALLATAERLRSTLSPARLCPHHDLGWSSGRLSFHGFLLQWPCEMELPVELNDEEFIKTACRAILLREPDAGEQIQYLKLLRDGAASKSWIIEDLLASPEFRSLERSVRVIFGSQFFTGTGSSQEDAPTVTWPWSSSAS